MSKERCTKVITYTVIYLAIACSVHISPNYAGEAKEDVVIGTQVLKDNRRPIGKLYDLAKKQNKKHAHLTFQSNRGIIAADLREMMRRSTYVIVGRGKKNRGYLNEEGDEIHRINTLYVQEVLKGEMLNAIGIEVKTLGGTWIYADGTALSWYPVDARPIFDGKSYIMFLNKEKEYYIPSFGVQGIFEIDGESRSIMPNDIFRLDPVVTKYKNAPLREFLNELRITAQEERLSSAF